MEDRGTFDPSPVVAVGSFCLIEFARHIRASSGTFRHIRFLLHPASCTCTLHSSFRSPFSLLLSAPHPPLPFTDAMRIQDARLATSAPPSALAERSLRCFPCAGRAGRGA